MLLQEVCQAHQHNLGGGIARGCICTRQHQSSWLRLHQMQQSWGPAFESHFEAGQAEAGQAETRCNAGPDVVFSHVRALCLLLS